LDVFILGFTKYKVKKYKQKQNKKKKPKQKTKKDRKTSAKVKEKKISPGGFRVICLIVLKFRW